MSLFDFFGRLWQGMLSWIGNLLSAIVTAVTNFFYALFRGLVDLVNGFIYLLSSALDVIILVITTLLYLVQVLFAFAGGIVRTLINLATFDPADITAMHNPYAQGTGILMDVLNRVGGDVLAQVFMWVWWFVLAVAVMYLIMGRGQAAE